MIQIEMEMSDKCSECRFRTDYDFCSAMPKNFCGNTSYEGKPDWCPLKNADGWISVKDRMPENDNPVLAWESQGFTHVDNYRKEEKWRKWQIGDCYGGTITHWMPLPEPPKEESDD